MKSTCGQTKKDDQGGLASSQTVPFFRLSLRKENNISHCIKVVIATEQTN